MKEAKITYGTLGVVETVNDPKREEQTIIIRTQGELKISDGYHTMDELYDHRIALYIALCRVLKNDAGHNGIWRSERHADGSKFDGWFILGINKEEGKQITYHLPMSKWTETEFAETLDSAPEWDKHTSQNVVYRLADV